MECIGTLNSESSRSNMISEQSRKYKYNKVNRKCTEKRKRAKKANSIIIECNQNMDHTIRI